MEQHLYPVGTKEISQKRKDLAPETLAAFQAFSHQVFADGALLQKTRQLFAVAVAHVTQYPYCIGSHTKQAKLKGATEQEIMEAIWVSAEMRAGGAVAHSILVIDAMSQNEARPGT